MDSDTLDQSVSVLLESRNAMFNNQLGKLKDKIKELIENLVNTEHNKGADKGLDSTGTEERKSDIGSKLEELDQVVNEILESGKALFKNQLGELKDEIKVLIEKMVKDELAKQVVVNPNSRFHREFEECEVLGSGGFGCVVRCKNKFDGQFYAVKKINIKETEVDLEHVLREVVAMSRLCHPSIIRYYSSWVEDKQGCYEVEGSDDLASPYLYIQMEYCCQNLQDLMMNNDRITNEDKAKWIRQILEGVCYMHKNHVRHGDLSPVNMFLDAQGDLKIGDFGLCSLTDEGVISDHSPPPPESWVSYAAPELEMNKYSLRSDIYSVGMIWIELLCNFATRSEKHTVLMALKKEEIFPELLYQKLPSELIELLVRLTKSDPDMRPDADLLLSYKPWKMIAALANC